MELRILSGNNLATSSQMAADDDLFHETLEKYSTQSKKDKDLKIITKDNALEACSELLEKKNSLDGFEAMGQVKTKFGKVWELHDIS